MPGFDGTDVLLAPPLMFWVPDSDSTDVLIAPMFWVPGLFRGDFVLRARGMGCDSTDTTQ